MLYSRSSLRARIPLELTHSTFSAEKPSEIIFLAAELHILCLTPASNSSCHNLLVLHPATLDILPWRTDMEEQKRWTICENTFPSSIPNRVQEEKKNIPDHTQEAKGRSSMRQWPRLTHILAATLSVLSSQKLRAPFPATAIKQPRCSCSKCLGTYEEYHSLTPRKRLTKKIHHYIRFGVRLLFSKNVMNSYKFQDVFYGLADMNDKLSHYNSICIKSRW